MAAAVAKPPAPFYTQALDIPSSADNEFLGREPTLYGHPRFEAVTSAQVLARGAPAARLASQPCPMAGQIPRWRHRACPAGSPRALRPAVLAAPGLARLSPVSGGLPGRRMTTASGSCPSASRRRRSSCRSTSPLTPRPPTPSSTLRTGCSRAGPTRRHPPRVRGPAAQAAGVPLLHSKSRGSPPVALHSQDVHQRMMPLLQ